MVGWHHQLNGHKSEQLRETVKDWEAWGAAVHGAAESNTTDRLNKNNGKNVPDCKFILGGLREQSLPARSRAYPDIRVRVSMRAQSPGDLISSCPCPRRPAVHPELSMGNSHRDLHPHQPFQIPPFPLLGRPVCSRVPTHHEHRRTHHPSFRLSPGQYSASSTPRCCGGKDLLEGKTTDRLSTRLHWDKQAESGRCNDAGTGPGGLRGDGERAGWPWLTSQPTRHKAVLSCVDMEWGGYQV